MIEKKRKLWLNKLLSSILFSILFCTSCAHNPQYIDPFRFESGGNKILFLFPKIQDIPEKLVKKDKVMDAYKKALLRARVDFTGRGRFKETDIALSDDSELSDTVYTKFMSEGNNLLLLEYAKQEGVDGVVFVLIEGAGLKQNVFNLDVYVYNREVGTCFPFFNEKPFYSYTLCENKTFWVGIINEALDGFVK